ncbi:guanylyl cyclase inhibitory protein, partial [Brienomyrus brachyistius]|uniref:guanylyl cyclase inhibitory protein n=1 Tax=Brienomyrus brachyistius TaxID=42636 RepID=UPI0020B40E86
NKVLLGKQKTLCVLDWYINLKTRQFSRFFSCAVRQPLLVRLLFPRKFIRECPSGLITLHEFRRHFCDGTVGTESAEYAEQVFRTLDHNEDGVVDFREYVTAISMLTKGSPVEKLRWSFMLYDKDKDGSITREEMLEIMQAVYKMSVAASLTKPNPPTAEECTNRIFVRLDKDNNAIISLDEFIEGAMDDKWIRETLECDPNTVKVEKPMKTPAII